MSGTFDHTNLDRAVPMQWFVAWGILLLCGFSWLNTYAFSAGRQEPILDARPDSSLIPFNGAGQTLAVFLHPKCPCSRATVGELTKLRSTRGDVDMKVVFYLPQDAPESWAHTGLWESATQLSSHSPLLDRGGAEAETFHATTSGHVILFSSQGEVLYSGGITDGRGHEGPNPGLAALERSLDGEYMESLAMPVFGCPINSNQRCGCAD